jgi:hypothetical protein
VTDNDVLLPAEAARRLGVPTRVVVQAMYEKRLPRVKLEDGTLGIPADALDTFQAYSASPEPSCRSGRPDPER